jgi:hypothetical protein
LRIEAVKHFMTIVDEKLRMIFVPWEITCMQKLLFLCRWGHIGSGVCIYCCSTALGTAAKRSGTGLWTVTCSWWVSIHQLNNGSYKFMAQGLSCPAFIYLPAQEVCYC